MKKRNEKLPAIIISGMAGAGKSTLARMLADHYNIEYVCGGDVLKEIAREEGYNPTENWWETKEGMEFLKKRQQSHEFDKKLDEILIKRAEKGNCIMTSWALPWIWGNGIKIWLHASQKTRAKRIVKRDGISFEEALEYVKKRDLENVKLYKELYGFELGKDLDVFDILMDVGDMSPGEMLENVVEVLEKQFDIKK
jgi:cytidylate kinase